jgi:hypothetical protein
MGSSRKGGLFQKLVGGAALTFFGKLTRAQGAPPREEPPVSYTGQAAAAELWGLCARPPAIGNSDFWRSFNMYLIPTRVRTVADKNSAVTPLDLRPTLADHVFKGNGIEV